MHPGHRRRVLLLRIAKEICRLRMIFRKIRILKSPAPEKRSAVSFLVSYYVMRVI